MLQYDTNLIFHFSEEETAYTTNAEQITSPETAHKDVHQQDAGMYLQLKTCSTCSSHIQIDKLLSKCLSSLCLVIRVLFLGTNYFWSMKFLLHVLDCPSLILHHSWPGTHQICLYIWFIALILITWDVLGIREQTKS